ncbi:MAG: benzoate/H(+) symporter BenE family transporter [Alphaproteobacteria bacterium]
MLPLSALSAAVIATLVGFAGTVALVIAAAQAVGATPGKTTSWLCAIAVAKLLGGLFLTLRYRMPVVLAWSTPGAALIAATSGLGMEAAVGAFLVTGALIVATAAVKPLADLVAKIPAGIAGAMLAGVLFRFVAEVALAVPQAPALVLPMVALFLVLRIITPAAAMLAVLAVGIILTLILGLSGPLPSGVTLSHVEIIVPRFEFAAIIGLAVPLYLVTMAAQNLPGFAVLRANGYEPPVRVALLVTGLGSMLSAPFGAHTHNMAAITAAIVAGPDAHPDRDKRWVAAVAYSACWTVIALFAASFVALFAAMPKALIVTVTGLALSGALMASLASAMNVAETRFAALLTFAVAASGLTLFGVGAAFWGLAIGLVTLGVEQMLSRVTKG